MYGVRSGISASQHQPALPYVGHKHKSTHRKKYSTKTTVIKTKSKTKQTKGKSCCFFARVTIFTFNLIKKICTITRYMLLLNMKS